MIGPPVVISAAGAKSAMRAACVDYKEVLSPEDFAVFSKLRDLRKAIGKYCLSKISQKAVQLWKFFCDPFGCHSNDHELPERGFRHGIEGDVLIESDETAVVFNRKGKQVKVGEVLGTKDGSMLEKLRVADAQNVRPEGMIGVIDERAETRGDFRHGETCGFAVGRRSHDANDTVFRKRARCP